MIPTIIYLKKKLIPLNYDVQRCEHSQNNTMNSFIKGNGFILIYIIEINF